MAKRVQIIGNTTAGTGTFVGLAREITIDTDKNELIVHTGAGAGTQQRVPNKATNDTLYQTLSTLLTAHAALGATSGFIAKTGAATVAARTMTGTAGQITVTNGSGASADPTFSIPNPFVAPGPISDSLGNVRSLHQTGSDKVTGYALVATDAGQEVRLGASGAATIPNSTFASTDMVTITNHTASSATITVNTTIGYIAGNTTNKGGGGTVTLAARGIMNVRFLSATECVMAGNIS